MPQGSNPVITEAADDWMKQAVLNKTPVDFGYDTHLWTCPILVALLLDQFGVKVSDTALRQHLKAMRLICQKPDYQDMARDEGEIAHFFNDKFPRIQRLAEKMEADIAFEDEAGVGVMTRHGRTWGMSGKTPVWLRYTLMDLPDISRPAAGPVRGESKRHGVEAAPEGDEADLPKTRLPGHGKGRRGNCTFL